MWPATLYWSADMIAVWLLSCLIAVTHAPGWTDPIEVIETPDNSTQNMDLVVTTADHLHQAWSKFGGESRVGYNLVLPDGTVLVPDQMISNDTSAGYPHMARLGEDSVVIVWQESYQFWFQVRDNGGTIITPTTMLPVPSSSRVRFDVACDSLRRIHLVCAQIISVNNEFVLYTVHNLDGSVVFQDTIPDNSYYDPYIHIDGNRVHIKFEAHEPWRTLYIQYDLDGNVTVSPVMLFDDDISTGHYTSIATDESGDAYVIVRKQPSGQPPYFALYKLDCETGDLLIDNKVIVQGPTNYNIANDLPAIEPLPDGVSFYLAWMREWGNTTLQVEFCIIDSDGDFIEDPYFAYDYTDEPIQQLEGLASSVNDDGDFYLTWCEGDTLVWGYYIVLGWFDHNWLGIEDEAMLVDPIGSTMNLSSNPFTTSLSITYNLSESAQAKLSVYDLSGRLVENLVNGSISAGEHSSIWNPDPSLPNGCYLIVLDACGERAVKRCVKLD